MYATRRSIDVAKDYPSRNMSSWILRRKLTATSGKGCIRRLAGAVCGFGFLPQRLVAHTFDDVDEFIRLFMCIKHMPASEIEALEGKLTGLRDRGENISLKLVALKDAWKATPDAKLLSTLALYHGLAASQPELFSR